MRKISKVGAGVCSLNAWDFLARGVQSLRSQGNIVPVLSTLGFSWFITDSYLWLRIHCAELVFS